MTLILTGLLGDGGLAVVEAIHLEAAPVKAFTVVVLIPAHQDIGQTGFADSCCTLKLKQDQFYTGHMC